MLIDVTRAKVKPPIETVMLTLTAEEAVTLRKFIGRQSDHTIRLAAGAYYGENEITDMNLLVDRLYDVLSAALKDD